MTTIHPSADVQTQNVGEGSAIWQYCVVLPGARVGARANICSHVFIENDVVIGDDVTIKNGVQLWDGVTIEDDVFIGPNVTFTNDMFPRSKQRPGEFARTVVRRGASVGANATILPGVTIGEQAMVGAGTVVTRSVPAYAIVVGNPGVITGYVNTDRLTPGTAAEASQSADLAGPELPVRGVRIHQTPVVNDIRGRLTAVEFGGGIPFEPVRIFLVYDVPSRETRGEHAHRECHQFLTCIRGSCAVVVDDGRNRQEILLNSPALGVYMPPMTWGVQYKYSSDAMLMVAASHPYDAADYIRSYEEFLDEVRRRR